MNKKIIFWIDDERNPEWFFSEEVFDEYLVIWIKNYQMFQFYLNHLGVPYAIQFDHDLGDNEKTGYDCAKLLVQYCMDNCESLPERYACHSANPVGRENILSVLNSYKKSLEL